MSLISTKNNNEPKNNLASERQMQPLTATLKVRLAYLTNLVRTKRVRRWQERKEIDKIPIEETMELLREVGIDVEQEKAELIMEFLYNLTMIIIRECFETE